jgi:hypothetical protein
MLLPELASIHETYLALCRLAATPFAGSLGGRLLLRSGIDPAGVAAIVAASVAGAASLCVDADPEALRSALRAGLCDFVVANLDEALRILKNEIRRGLPVSVGLAAEPAPCIAGMIDRGVQPDLFFPEHIEPRAVSVFLQRGAIAVTDADGHAPGTSLLLWTMPAGDPRAMPRIAAIAADALEPARADTPARRRWLHASPRFLGRSFASRQCLRATAPEAAAFIRRAADEFPDAVIAQERAPL